MEKEILYLLQYLYSKFQSEHEVEKQILFTDDDYGKIKGKTVDDRIAVNKLLLNLQGDGYISCPHLKSTHIIAAWITITKKTLDYFDKKRGANDEQANKT